jgi:hypothetical protein
MPEVIYISNHCATKANVQPDIFEAIIPFSAPNPIPQNTTLIKASSACEGLSGKAGKSIT